MAFDPIVQCLQMLTDYFQFERLCTDVMIKCGYPTIEPLGGTKDEGRDGIYVSRQTGHTTLFAYSVRQDWKKKLMLEDAATIHKHGHPCNDLVFASTADISATQRDSATSEVQKTFGWRLELFDVERLRASISQHREMIADHPAIFHPSLFPSVQAASPLLGVLRELGRLLSRMRTAFGILMDPQLPISQENLRAAGIAGQEFRDYFCANKIGLSSPLIEKTEASWELVKTTYKGKERILSRDVDREAINETHAAWRQVQSELPKLEQILNAEYGVHAAKKDGSDERKQIIWAVKTELTMNVSNLIAMITSLDPSQVFEALPIRTTALEWLILRPDFLGQQTTMECATLLTAFERARRNAESGTLTMITAVSVHTDASRILAQIESVTV